ncbi:MAG: anhydro-N-acetylmuramic acid kinase [Candidatus Zipacnadales bacterium]
MALSNWLLQYETKPERLLIGLMSGTSADAITAAVVQLKGMVPEVRVKCLASHQHPLPAEIVEQVRRPRRWSPADLAVLNVQIGERFAEAALAAMEAVGLCAADVDAIASHGQTMVHVPEQHATLQLGEPSIIAERTGVLTVAEFRYRDLAAGGQGAPLVPLADYALFHSEAVCRAVQNIGGIANVTWLPAGGTLKDVIAFDTGPGNMAIDGVIQLGSRFRYSMDENGRFGAAGPVDEKKLTWLLRNEYFHRPPPKTAGREQFGYRYARMLLRVLKQHDMKYYDIVPTVTALTAASIAHAYRTHLPAMPEEVIVGGGGTRNPTLMQMLRERLPECHIMTHEDFGLPDVAKEAIAFCILANETLLGRPGNVPSATGAKRAVLLGKIVLP